MLVLPTQAAALEFRLVWFASCSSSGPVLCTHFGMCQCSAQVFGMSVETTMHG
jgi:hypothetical protein